jgi:predicted GH43/DUF377 family glycosyl hydrolase
MNNWIKKGLIFVPNQNYSWIKTHAALPIPINLNDENLRIYFSSRDENNIASVGFLETNIKEPTKIKYITEKPILSPGSEGCFDDKGIMAHSMVSLNDKLYLYYTGWNVGQNVPFRWAIGLAISNDGGKTFEKFSNGPIMDRTTIDPYFVASPTVLLENGKWRMWYSSGLGWEKINGTKRIPYHIRYAESNDGINWQRNGKICIDFTNKNETRIGRPTIQKEDNIYKMWYSYALEKYRIGYAESLDGITWERKDDQAGIDISESDWDSEMIEYPFVFKYKGAKYMLYNGNDYGRTGFGYAILEQ